MIREGILFHHNNAEPLTAKTTLDKILISNWELFARPPYSLYLTPTDFYLHIAIVTKCSKG